ERRYTGQIQDAADMYFYNARYYDPTLGKFLQADTIVPEPGNPQSFNRYSYVLNNPLKYTDPTGHFEESEIAAAYGVDNVKDIWWWDDPYYAGWQQILLSDVTWGDILVAEVGGKTYEVMFIRESPRGSGIVLWDINNSRSVDPDLFSSPQKWQLYRSQTQDYQNYTRGALPGFNSNSLLEPQLPVGWDRGVDGEHIHTYYTYPSWTWGDTGKVALGAGGGALGGTILVPAGGPVSAGVGALTGVVITGGGILIDKVSGATLNPIHSLGYKVPYYSTRPTGRYGIPHKDKRTRGNR
nr:RHS repeat-associated core domain-containing protein [Ardenticatenales bacterium]